MLTTISKIERVAGVTGFSFDVTLHGDDFNAFDGMGESVVTVTAAELSSYSSFCKAVLAKHGEVFGHEQFEGRKPAEAWRYEIDSHLSRKPNSAAAECRPAGVIANSPQNTGPRAAVLPNSLQHGGCLS